MALDEKVIEELKAKHGSAFHLPFPKTANDDELDIVVKRPPRAEYKRFRSMLFNESLKPEALETLAKACVVYPDGAAFEALSNVRPALAEAVGGKVAELAGGGETEAKSSSAPAARRDAV